MITMMRDYQAFKVAAIRYWERRRIFYNLALVPAALLSYGLTDTVSWVGDPHERHVPYVAFLFGVAALGANICYSFAYALEFLFGADDPDSGWLTYGRTFAFWSGTLFAIILALLGGRHIAMMEFYYHARHAGSI